jgi:hypothetical protein
MESGNSMHCFKQYSKKATLRLLFGLRTTQFDLQKELVGENITISKLAQTLDSAGKKQQQLEN